MDTEFSSYFIYLRVVQNKTRFVARFPNFIHSQNRKWTNTLKSDIRSFKFLWLSPGQFSAEKLEGFVAMW